MNGDFCFFLNYSLRNLCFSAIKRIAICDKSHCDCYHRIYPLIAGTALDGVLKDHKHILNLRIFAAEFFYQNVPFLRTERKYDSVLQIFTAASQFLDAGRRFSASGSQF